MTRRKTSKAKENKIPKTKKTNIDLAALSALSSEEMLSDLFGDIEEKTPLKEAQDIIYDAWEVTDPNRRVALARKALETSPDCADAYALLAEEAANSFKEALNLYRQGVEAGERALGKEAFEKESKRAGKRQFLTYYFIAAHPGCSMEEMEALHAIAVARVPAAVWSGATRTP